MHSNTAAILLTLLSTAAAAREYHVAVTGHDEADGSPADPLRTISSAAALAQPADVVTVHEGVYREQISPPRGGESDQQRIVYQAAPGEDVVIKGSEVVKGWTRVQSDAWRVTIPNAFFGNFNPYVDRIRGDWFDPHGRDHHTGAVYLNNHWLTEAAELDHVLQPTGTVPLYAPGGNEYLLNVAWIQFVDDAAGAAKVPATHFAEQHGIQVAACSEGGECIGWINHGDWVAYHGVRLSAAAKQLEIRAASATEGGVIEVRRASPDGPLLGSCSVPNTGGWQSWETFAVPLRPAEGVETLCLTFRSGRPEASEVRLWFAEVGESDTTIWAQFPTVDPNEADVEINVRQSVFYPAKAGVNYITVRGFKMMHAATPWAPPTAEQIGLIGSHWSRGWVIENNDISYSTCVGITLGKHGDAFDNTSQNSAEGYVETIERAFEHGWSKETIGHHVVRNNHISHCEQAGIVGSLGAVFSRITGNVIHDIHVRRLFSGAEMAGIKIHAAIDTEISHNHIYDTCLGIWLDWMAQGTRVTGNLLHDNGPSGDLFMEVNHGPYVIDNNVFLSATSLLNVSEGGAFAHNLFTGRIMLHPEPNRSTPFHKAHSTEIAGLLETKGGDDRFYNNLFAGGNGLAPYDSAARPVFMAGNVFLQGAKPSRFEEDPVFLPEVDPGLQLTADRDGIFLKMTIDPDVLLAPTQLVVTDVLGAAAASGVPYLNVDASPLRLDADYTGKGRSEEKPTPGPFEGPGSGKVTIEVR